MAMRTKPRAPQTLAVMENAHFSDSASSHNGASDDESHLQYTATGLGGDALAKQGSGKRRRSGGLPSLISKSGSRSNLGIDAGITRAHEIRSQAAAAEKGGFAAHLHPGTSEASLRMSGSGRVGSSATRSAQELMGQDAVAIATLESSSSEGDMTWEDFLASTDESGDTASAATATVASATSLGTRRPKQPPLLPGTLPPAGMRVVANTNGGSALERRPPPPAQPPHPSTSMSREAPLPSHNGLATVKVKETAGGFSTGLMSWGKSKAVNIESDDSAPESAGSDHGGGVGGMKQELTWGQYVIQNKVEPSPRSNGNWRVPTDPPRKISAEIDVSDDDDDDDIDDIMSTFGPVSIRPDQDDILFARKEEEILLIIDRNDGDTAKSNGNGISSVSAVGKTDGGGGGPQDTFGSGPRDNVGQGNGGSFPWLGGGTRGHDGGGRISTGFRGRVENGKSSPTRSPPSAKQSLGHKKPSFPPPSYGSVGRPRESPLLPSPPPPQPPSTTSFVGATVGNRQGLGRAPNRGGRRSEDLAAIGWEGPSGRQGSAVDGHDLQPRTKGTSEPQAGLGVNPLGVMPRSHPAADATRPLDGGHWQLRNGSRRRASTEADDAQRQNRLGVPLAELRRPNSSRKDSLHPQGAAQSYNHNHVVGAGFQGMGCTSGGGAGGAASEADPVSPPPYSAGNQRPSKDRSKGGLKRSTDNGRSGGGSSSRGVGGVSLAGGGGGVQSQKLTASALQRLQPEGVPGSFWGQIQRSRNRDTLHHLIEGHAQRGAVTFDNSPPHDTPARERSLTEDSQVRPRPRTSSGGPTTAEAPPSTGGNESSGVGNTNAGTSGGGGGGGLSFGLRLNIGTNTASALRSAISLRRNDTSTSTSDSVGSRVMRTLSTMSSGVRSTAEMSNAIQQAAAAATGGVGGGAGRGQEDLPSVTTEQQQLASSHQDVVATQLPSSTNVPPENRSLSVDMLYAHGGIIPRRWIGRNMNPQASQQQVGTGGRETALSKGRPLSHDFTSQGQALRPVHSAVVAAENLRKQEEERQRATGKNSETAVMAVAEERNRRIRSQTRAQVERLKAEKLLETTPLHERALLGRNPAMIEPFGGQPQAGNRRRRPSTGATGEIETTEHRMRLFVARAGEEKKRAAVEADLARAAVAAAAEEAAAAAEAEAAMVSAAREQSMRARKVSAVREVEVEIKKNRAELEVALKARERRETADLIAEREWNEKRERAERSRDRFERERLDREQLNQDRLERERLERERARLEQERLEQGRLERERLEQERLEQERLEQERLEKERLEQERLEKERLEQERLEKERLEQGRLERERLEKEQLEQERLERERLEQERLEKERLEQGRLEQERLEKERLEHERLDRERFELERLGREQSNRERLEKERMEKDRLTKERSEKERVDKVIPEDMLSSFLKSKEPALANLEVTAIARGTGQAGFFAQTPERIAPAFSADPSAEARLNAGTTDSIDDGRGESEEAGGLLPTLPKESPAPIMNQGSSKTCSVVANGVVAMTPGSNVHSPEKAIVAATEQEGQSGAETVTVVEEDPSPPAPLTQQERDENIMRAHLASWRFCFHEAAALLTPVLGSSYVEAPNGAGGAVDPVAHSAMPTGNAFFAGPQEETDLHSELWAKLVQAEALMLQTLLSVSSGATKDTLEACEAVHETLESCLPPNKSAMWDDIAFKLAGAAEVVQARIDESSPASPEALEAVSVPPTLTEQAILLELEVLMVTVAMQLMVGQVIKAAKTTHKFIKISHWLLKAKDVDAKAAKRARNKATAPPTSGVTMIQNFFFNKKSAPAPAPTSTSVRPAATAVSRRGEGKINGGGGKLVDLRSPPSLPPSLPPRMRIANGNGSGSSSGSGSGSQDSSDDMYLFLEEAVPREFAGRSWEGYLHHVDFLVALMHVGTSLIPKSLMKLIERFMSYTPSFEKGLSLLSECCRTKGMRRPCAAAVLELLMFRELKREAKLMKAGKASKATTTGARTSQKEEPTNGKRGFRRRIQFRQAGDGGGGSSLSRAAALDEAQVALDLFYSSFPVVPLLSVAHAKALQTSGNFEEAYELCLMAQKVVEQSVEKGGGMGPAHDPHVLWLQLGLSSFFLQRWTQALDVFTRIMQGVAQVCEKDQRGLTGFSAAYAAASMCGVQPVVQEEVHKLLEVACAAIKKQEAAGAKEHRGLRDRLEGYASRGPPGAELWLFELLYLHNASAANSMPEAWHESMLELLGETPVAAMSMAFPQEGVKYSRSQTDAIMAHKFTEGLVLYKLERMEESLDTFRWIVDCARDKDEPQGMISDIGIPKVVLTESRFVLPHALYLTAHLSYRLRPVEDQLYLSHDLCARAKKIKDYDFDCQVKIGNLMASLRNYMDAIESAAR